MVGTTRRIDLLPLTTLGKGEERVAGPIALLPGEPACLFVDFDGPLERWVEVSRDGVRWDLLDRARGITEGGALVTTATLVPGGAGRWLRCRVRSGPGGVRVSVVLHVAGRG